MTAGPNSEMPALSSAEDAAGISASDGSTSADIAASGGAASEGAAPEGASHGPALAVPTPLGAEPAPPMPVTPFRWTTLLFGLMPVLAIGLLIFFEVPICPTRNLFGFPCPGCGLTRATGAMITGDFAAMLRFHPLAPIISPIVLFSLARVFLVSVGLLKTNVDPLGRLPKWAWYVLATALLGLWIGRAFGLFGGLPDAIDPAAGWLYRFFRFAFYDFWVEML